MITNPEIVQVLQQARIALIKGMGWMEIAECADAITRSLQTTDTEYCNKAQDNLTWLIRELTRQKKARPWPGTHRLRTSAR